MMDYNLKDITNDRMQEITANPVSMLRTVRLVSQEDLQLDAVLEQVIKQNAANILQAAPQDIRKELDQILLQERPSRALSLMHDLGLLSHVLPELEVCYNFEQHSRHHNRNVFDHTLLVVDKSPARLEVRLAALYHDIAKPACFTMGEDQAGHFYNHHRVGSRIARESMQRLGYEAGTIEAVSNLVEHHMSRFLVKATTGAAQLIDSVGIAHLPDLFDLQQADTQASLPGDDFTHLEELRCLVESLLASPGTSQDP